jgi:hypothetical protein
MKYVDEFRSGEHARTLAREIAALTVPGRPVHLMEVCGGHTHTIYGHGLQALVPPEVEFVHGPGCPVCVIPKGRVDDAISLAERPEVLLATFGGMMRVPGGRLAARGEGPRSRRPHGLLAARRAPEAADEALAALRRQPLGAHAAVVGAVDAEPRGLVLLDTAPGGSPIVDMLVGDPFAADLLATQEADSARIRNLPSTARG